MPEDMKEITNNHKLIRTEMNYGCDSSYGVRTSSGLNCIHARAKSSRIVNDILCTPCDPGGFSDQEKASKRRRKIY